MRFQGTTFSGSAVRIGAAAALASAMGACGASNPSSPTLSITQARMSADEATLDFTITNPGSLDLALREIDYSLVHGPLPVASGRWTGQEALPPDGQLAMTLPIRFDHPPVDPAATHIEFSGEMSFEDKSNTGKMRFETATFNEQARVRR